MSQCQQHAAQQEREQHTPEPWVFGNGQTKQFGMCLGIGLNTAPDWLVVAVVSPVESVNDVDKANARRIVACVNACAGTPTEELEIIIDAGETMKICFDRLTKQRDDLLAAGRDVVNRWDSPLWKDQPHTAEFIDALREAIASVKNHIPEAGQMVKGGAA